MSPSDFEAFVGVTNEEAKNYLLMIGAFVFGFLVSHFNKKV